jgi:hypothetical protein
MQNRTQYTASQSIPIDWLQCPKEKDRASLVEFVRGTLCSLAMQEDESFVPVHISRIQRSFKKLGAVGLYKAGLRLIQLLGEVEPLHGGYWLPTPYRVLEIADELVFIGASPNAHGLLGEIRMEGLSRLIAQDVAEHFPRQSLEGWMDLTTQDPSTIVSAFMVAHTRMEAKTSNLAGVMYLNLIPSHATGQSCFQWSDRKVGVLATGKIAICRQPHLGRMRYFSASLGKGGVTTEAPIDFPMTRLLFAIAQHVGAPVKVVERSGEKGVEVTVGERLPIEEFRLALLVSKKISRSGQSTTYLISPKLAPAFRARLALLGCAVETRL